MQIKEILNNYNRFKLAWWQRGFVWDEKDIIYWLNTILNPISLDGENPIKIARFNENIALQCCQIEPDIEFQKITPQQEIETNILLNDGSQRIRAIVSSCKGIYTNKEMVKHTLFINPDYKEDNDKEAYFKYFCKDTNMFDDNEGRTWIRFPYIIGLLIKHNNEEITVYNEELQSIDDKEFKKKIIHLTNKFLIREIKINEITYNTVEQAYRDFEATNAGRTISDFHRLLNTLSSKHDSDYKNILENTRNEIISRINVYKHGNMFQAKGEKGLEILLQNLASYLYKRRFPDSLGIIDNLDLIEKMTPNALNNFKNIIIKTYDIIIKTTYKIDDFDSLLPFWYLFTKRRYEMLKIYDWFEKNNNVTNDIIKYILNICLHQDFRDKCDLNNDLSHEEYDIFTWRNIRPEGINLLTSIINPSIIGSNDTIEYHHIIPKTYLKLNDTKDNFGILHFIEKSINNERSDNPLSEIYEGRPELIKQECIPIDFLNKNIYDNKNIQNEFMKTREVLLEERLKKILDMYGLLYNV